MTNAGVFRIEARFAVHEGRLEAVDAIRAQMIEHAHASGAPAFEVLLGDGDRQLTVRATAEDEEAIRQLLLRVGPDLERLEANAHVTALECAGEFSAALRKALTPFSATFL